MTTFSAARHFTIQLNGSPVQIEAAISATTNEIFAVNDANGEPVETTSADLDAIEAQLDAIQETTFDAIDPDSGAVETVTVVSLGLNIMWIVRADGSTVARSSAQFTEYAECFHIDREYAAAVDSDQPHAAARAGFLFPTHPIPTQQGHGLRRAA